MCLHFKLKNVLLLIFFIKKASKEVQVENTLEAWKFIVGSLESSGELNGQLVFKGPRGGYFRYKRNQNKIYIDESKDKVEIFFQNHEI